VVAQLVAHGAKCQAHRNFGWSPCDEVVAAPMAWAFPALWGHSSRTTPSLHLIAEQSTRCRSSVKRENRFVCFGSAVVAAILSLTHWVVKKRPYLEQYEGRGTVRREAGQFGLGSVPYGGHPNPPTAPGSAGGRTWQCGRGYGARFVNQTMKANEATEPSTNEIAQPIQHQII
jgi:hypothetical protein